MSRKHLPYSILLTASVVALPSQTLFAQGSSDDAMDEVVVTGSRLRGAEAPVGSPIVSLDRDDIQASPAISVDQMIKEVPQVFDLGVSEASRGQSGGSSNIIWGNSINLRGIGPYATLTLVDGHRVNSNGSAIDPSVLPSLALERVEIVADGSSAVYGSDAVAGVVNLIMRRDVDGAEFVAQYGGADDFDQYKFGLSWGTTWDNGSFFVAAEKGQRSELNGNDRDFFTSDQRPNADYRVNRCSPGTMVVGGVNYAIPVGGVTPANNDQLIADTSNLCEGLPNQDLLPRQEYENLAFTSKFEFSDTFTWLLDGFYADRSFTRSPASFSGALVVPDTNAFFVAPQGMSPTSVTVNYSFIDDLAPDEQTGGERSWEMTSGFELDVAGDWRVKGLMTYGDLYGQSNTTAGLDSRGPTSSLAVALASSDPATAFDPFGLHRTSAATLAAISDQVFIAKNTHKMKAYELHTDGSLMELPGGNVQLALGIEQQELSYEPWLKRGSASRPYSKRFFERDIRSAYAELLIPVFGADNAIPGIHSLQLNIAARRDEYSDLSENTTNPKYGITWEPTDSLTVRASYGTSFRAPLFSQLYGNSSALFVQPYSDPTNGGAVVQGVALSGGNLDLTPEEAETWSAGFDYSPEFLPEFSLSMTYFDVTYEGQIEAYLADLSILALESEFAGTGIILRDAAADAHVNDLLADGFGYARGVPPVPVTLFVDGRTNNLGRTETSGFDVAVNYGLALDDYGTIDFKVSGMYIADYKEAITPTGQLNDYRNTIFNPLTLKTRSSVNWSLENLATRLTWNHVNSYTNDRAATPETVSAFNTFDLDVAWTFGESGAASLSDGLVLGMNIKNLLDEEPPYANIAPGVNGGGGYDPTAASPLGRMISVFVRKNL
ncbi:TonB-dependent receptor [Aurantivibrio plasticivorans]